MTTTRRKRPTAEMIEQLEAIRKDENVIEPPRSKEEEAPWRTRSIRASRRRLQLITHWVMTGALDARSGQLMAQMLSTEAELLMTELLLASKGIEDREPVHPDGIDGGTTPPLAAPEPPPSVSVERITGVGQAGKPVDLTTVTVTGGQRLRDSLPAFSLAPPDPAEPEPPPPPMTRRLMGATNSEEDDDE